MSSARERATENIYLKIMGLQHSLVKRMMKMSPSSLLLHVGQYCQTVL